MNLGKHGPIIRVLREGIIRVQIKVMQKLANEPVDEWFSQGNQSYTKRTVRCSVNALLSILFVGSLPPVVVVVVVV